MNTTIPERGRTVHHIANSAEENPYHRPSFSVKYRLMRQLWQVVYALLYRPSPLPMHAWRSMLLCLFGAKMGPGCHFYPSGRVWAPWNLISEDCCTLADHAEIYNPSPIYLESHCVISQGAYICGATHDYNHPDFPMISYSMRLGAYSWICARASVSPGVNVGEGAVLGLGSVANRDLEPWTVYSGVPAVGVKKRVSTRQREMKRISDADRAVALQVSRIRDSVKRPTANEVACQDCRRHSSDPAYDELFPAEDQAPSGNRRT